LSHVCAISSDQYLSESTIILSGERYGDIEVKKKVIFRQKNQFADEYGHLILIG
jgi:hypothetical protein